jgi:succinate dehydrogenase / fumarate reductase flavoprotein subunit
MKIRNSEHDVLIIGAGGAGSRAAIAALGRVPPSPGYKSLPAAHTVMAEGGIAAAMANIVRQTVARTRDTIRGEVLNLADGADPRTNRRTCSGVGAMGRV